MSRIDYYRDPNAPKANSLIPAASAVVVNESGEILLHRRSDSGSWSIPGGAMEPGETIRDTAVREVKEETGYDVQVERLVGIYTDPAHVAAYSDGEVRQQFSVCFACRLLGGSSELSDESLEVAFFQADDLDELQMHESIRLRIQHFLERRDEPYVS